MGEALSDMVHQMVVGMPPLPLIQQQRQQQQQQQQQQGHGGGRTEQACSACVGSAASSSSCAKAEPGDSAPAPAPAQAPTPAQAPIPALPTAPAPASGATDAPLTAVEVLAAQTLVNAVKPMSAEKAAAAEVLGVDDVLASLLAALNSLETARVLYSVAKQQPGVICCLFKPEARPMNSSHSSTSSEGNSVAASLQGTECGGRDGSTIGGPGMASNSRREAVLTPLAAFLLTSRLEELELQSTALTLPKMPDFHGSAGGTSPVMETSQCATTEESALAAFYTTLYEASGNAQQVRTASVWHKSLP